MFAAGGKKGKGADKEGAARFKKDIITYKNQALQPVSALLTMILAVAEKERRERHDGCKRNLEALATQPM